VRVEKRRMMNKERRTAEGRRNDHTADDGQSFGLSLRRFAVPCSLFIIRRFLPPHPTPLPPGERELKQPPIGTCAGPSGRGRKPPGRKRRVLGFRRGRAPGLNRPSSESPTPRGTAEGRLCHCPPQPGFVPSGHSIIRLHRAAGQGGDEFFASAAASRPGKIRASPRGSSVEERCESGHLRVRASVSFHGHGL